ncbi:unnamed protein product [Lota lota]
MLSWRVKKETSCETEPEHGALPGLTDTRPPPSDTMFPAALISLLLVGAGGLAAATDDGDCYGTRCYAAFTEPADFQTARDKCSELAGHLMTVRTSNSHAVLRRMLERSAGPHWVGLYRPAGCPDTASPLRGFRWETGDRGSDFYNWATAADRSGCARQCVSVSSEDGFKWSAGSCDGRAAGFLCEYRRGDACEPTGVSGNYTRPPYGGQSGDMKSLPHGTVATRDSDGSTSMCLSGEWVRAPWTCGMNEGGCEFKCSGTEVRPVCLCPPGHVLSQENPVTCVEVQDAPCQDLGCDHGCGGDPPACACRPGFLLGADGRSCRDPLGLPVCGRGYRSTVAQACEDVDECQQAPCEHECSNTAGSFACSCFEGYRVDPKDPVRCQPYCGLAQCPAECDPNDPEDCKCPDGYILDGRPDGGFCVDIDECSNFYCDQLCDNTFGDYTCRCNAGFSLVGGNRCVLGTLATNTTVSYVPTSTPDPTGKPGRLSAGGLVAVVGAVAVVVFLVVILAFHFANRRNGGLAASHGKAERGEGRKLEQVAETDVNEKPPPLEE